MTPKMKRVMPEIAETATFRGRGCAEGSFALAAHRRGCCRLSRSELRFMTHLDHVSLGGAQVASALTSVANPAQKQTHFLRVNVDSYPSYLDS